MITVNELFSGIGTQSLAFEYLGIPHKIVGMAEISDPAIKAYEVLHGPTRNYGDISQINSLDYADFWTYSFPCFIGDTLVLTDKGYVKIKDITVGMQVVTHEKRMRKVIASQCTGKKEISELSTAFTTIKTTKNHKFLVRLKTRCGYSQPTWVACEDIVIGDLVGVNKHSKNKHIHELVGLMSANYEYELEDSKHYWVQVTNVNHSSLVEEVYDIEVEEDHSFVVEGITVHNCQDLSAGGKGAGMKEGTRSGLLWQVERLLEKAVKEDNTAPKFLLLENVPDINKKKHKADFDKWLAKLDSLGYDNYYCVLEACDYGVPQLRRRMFVVSTRKDLNRYISFDEDDYFVPPHATFVKKTPNPGFAPFVEDWVNEYSGPLMVDPTISPAVRANFERDKELISRCDAAYTNIFSCECTSGFQDNQVGIKFAPTIRHQNSHTAIYHNNQIHKLTAREAWRFMGIKGEDYDRVEAETGIGKNTLHGLAGNAIVVNVLMAIYKAMFIEGVDY